MFKKSYEFLVDLVKEPLVDFPQSQMKYEVLLLGTIMDSGRLGQNQWQDNRFHPSVWDFLKASLCVYL